MKKAIAITVVALVGYLGVASVGAAPGGGVPSCPENRDAVKDDNPGTDKTINGVSFSYFTLDGVEYVAVYGAGVLEVYVKGGPANAGPYFPPVDGATAPVNPNTGLPYGISHVLACKGQPTPPTTNPPTTTEPESTTTVPEAPTTVPEAPTTAPEPPTTPPVVIIPPEVVERPTAPPATPVEVPTEDIAFTG